MSSAPELTGDDRLAAELVLRLLEGDELAEADRRIRDEPAFLALVGAWEKRLAPVLDEIPEEAPPGQVWGRIAARLGEESGEEATIHQLRRKANVWRAYSVGITAVAAALVLVIGLDVAKQDPVLQPPPPPAAATLVASLGTEGGPTALIITYDPDSRSLIATPAVLEGAAGHDHELWVVPASGAPRSLGIVTAGRPRKIDIPPALLRAIGANATLAVSVEPEGGSPTGRPTGPVIASGQLTRI